MGGISEKLLFREPVRSIACYRNLRRGLPGQGSLVWLLLIPVLFLSGCSKSSYRQQVQQDLQLRAQERIFRKAEAEFTQGHYDQAIRLLQHFFGIHSRSPLGGEARWLLARSYKNNGDLQSALEQYKVIARGLPPGKNKQETLGRIAELELNVGGRNTDGGRLHAVRISLSHYASIRDIESTLKRIARHDVESVLIDFGCRSQLKHKVRVEVGDRSVGSTHALIYDRLPSYIAQIHDQKLRAFVGINLRCLGDWAPKSNAAWVDQAYDPVTQRVHSSHHFDLFNPQYQEFLGRFLMKFVTSDVDGIVFLADLPIGAYDGLTSHSGRSFHEAFQVRLNPQTLFLNGHAGRNPKLSSVEHQLKTSTISPSPQFWRWAGWKTRQRLAVLQHLIEQVHQQKAEFQFGLEVHPDSLENPLRALATYSEDILEANQKSFAFFFVNLQPDHDSQSKQSQFDTKKSVHRSRKLVDRMVVITKDSSKVWVNVPLQAKKNPTGAVWSGGLGLLQGLVEVYNYQSLP